MSAAFPLRNRYQHRNSLLDLLDPLNIGVGDLGNQYVFDRLVLTCRIFSLENLPHFRPTLSMTKRYRSEMVMKLTKA